MKVYSYHQEMREAEKFAADENVLENAVAGKGVAKEAGDVDLLKI